MVLKKKAGSVYAFTLSEVLVALSIIGIIASITIPGILANAERSKFDNLFKKSYSNISEAIKRVTTNNGNVPLACYYMLRIRMALQNVLNITQMAIVPNIPF